jgi:hypothetical protein
VRRDGAETSDDKLWMMSGGLYVDTINIYSENALDDLVHEAEASRGQQWMMSGGLGADLADIYPENTLDDFAYGARGYPVNGTILDAYMMSNRFARDEPARPYEEAAGGYHFEEEFLWCLSKPGDTVRTTECSSCKRFKCRGANFQDHISPVPTFDPSAPLYMGRNWPILAQLRSDGTLQDEEGGLLGRIGWMCCEKCGSQMHLL